jgi:hypothetical protein
MNIINKLLIRFNVHNPNDSKQLLKLKSENNALKSELKKVKAGVNLLIKESQNTKYIGGNNDQKIIDNYNSHVPKESATTDINVALHAYKSFIDAQNTQKLKELIAG